MTRLIETYIPPIQEDGYKSAKNITTTGAVSSATLAVSGTSAFTGVATFTAAPVFTAAPTGPFTQVVVPNALVGATVVLTAADSGKVFVNRSTSGTPSWTLPTAANGLTYTFVVASTTAGFTVTGGTIKAKTNAAGTAISGTTLTNTQGTAVVGDTITLVCDGTSWLMIAQSGIFAAA
jgi:hypothetical protein